MRPLKIQDLKVGMRFYMTGDPRKVPLEIKSFDGSRCDVGYAGYPRGMGIPAQWLIDPMIYTFINTDIPEYYTQCKPLDHAFKELDRQICSHRNIREDRFFSAMVYKTCKDCGKNLN